MTIPSTFNELKIFAAARHFGAYLGWDRDSSCTMTEEMYTGLLSGKINTVVALPNQTMTISGSEGETTVPISASLDPEKFEYITLSADGLSIRYTDAYLASLNSSSDSGGSSSNNNNNNNNNNN